MEQPMSVDVAQLTVAVTADATSLRTALTQAEAANRQWAAQAVASAKEATVAQQGYDQAVSRSVSGVVQLGNETIKYNQTLKQHGAQLTSVLNTSQMIDGQLVKTRETIKQGETALQSLTQRWLAFANLGSIVGLPGAGIAAQAGMAATGLEAAAGSSGKLSTALAAIGPVGLALGATAAIGIGATAAALVDATAKAAGFEQVLTRIQNNTGLSDAQVKQLGVTSLQLAAATGADPAVIATAEMHAQNIVKNPLAAQAVTQIATESAVSTGADPVATATMVAQAVHEYKKDESTAATPALQYQEILGNVNQLMGQLHVAVQQSGVEQGPYADALARPLGVGANIGFSPADVMAVLSTASLHGFPDIANASTQEQSLETRMLNPTPKAEAALQKLANLSDTPAIAAAFDPGNLAANGLVGTMNDLKAALEKSGLAQADQTALMGQIVPAQRGGQLAMALVGTGNQDLNSISGKLDAVMPDNTIAVQSLTKTLDTTVGQWNLLKERIATGMIDQGSGPNTAVGSVLTWINTQAATTAVGSDFAKGVADAVGGWLHDVGTKGIIATVQADRAPAPPMAAGYQGDPAQARADHAAGLQSSTGLAAAQATDAVTQSMAAQARQANATASATDAMVQQTTQQHAALSAQLATTQRQYAGVIDPMQTKVNAAEQTAAEAGLQATVATDRVHDQYDAPLKAAQDELAALHAAHTAQMANTAEETAAAHAAHDQRIQDLQDEIKALADQNKYQQEQVQLTDQIAQNEASLAQAAALGDPAKRAKDQGTIAQAQATSAVAAAHQRVQQLTVQLARTPDNARNHDIYVQAKAALDEAKAQLDEARQVNPTALGAATTQGAIAGSTAQAHTTTAGIANARTALAEIPLQQALDKEQATLDAQLLKIQAQTTAYEDQYRQALPPLQKAVEDITKREQDALAVITAQTRAQQEVVDTIKAALLPQIDAQTAAEAAAVKPINDQITQIVAVQQAWQTAKDDVDAYTKALAAGDPAQIAATRAAAAGARSDAIQVPLGGTRDPNTGIPTQGGAGGTISAVAGASLTSFAATAQSRLGQSMVDYCEKFVEQVTGSDRRFATAVQAAANLNLTGGNPLDAPVGSVLYYANLGKDSKPLQARQDASGAWQNAGHAAIKEAGNVQIGSDDNGVSAEAISAWAAKNHQQYLGYYVPPPSADYGHGGGSNGGGQGGVVVNITLSDGAIKLDGATGTNAAEVAGIVHDTLTQLAHTVAARITPGAPRNVPGNVRA
jgi:hypothetical protein